MEPPDRPRRDPPPPDGQRRREEGRRPVRQPSHDGELLGRRQRPDWNDDGVGVGGQQQQHQGQQQHHYNRSQQQHQQYSTEPYYNEQYHPPQRSLSSHPDRGGGGNHHHHHQQQQQHSHQHPPPVLPTTAPPPPHYNDDQDARYHSSQQQPPPPRNSFHNDSVGDGSAESTLSSRSLRSKNSHRPSNVGEASRAVDGGGGGSSVTSQPKSRPPPPPPPHRSSHSRGEHSRGEQRSRGSNTHGRDGKEQQRSRRGSVHADDLENHFMSASSGGGRSGGGGGGSISSRSRNSNYGGGGRGGESRPGRGRRSSDYSEEDDDEDDGYMVGRGVHSVSSNSLASSYSNHQHYQHHHQQQQQQQEHQQQQQQQQQGRRQRNSSSRRDTDDRSFGGLLDESNRGGGGGDDNDVWSINKSVFSQFDRLPGNNQNRSSRGRTKGGSRSSYHDDYDDSGSAFSGASSAFSYNDNRRQQQRQQQQTPKAIRRSSSNASRISQISGVSKNSQQSRQSEAVSSIASATSSANSSFRFPKKYYARSSNYEYDSDDSIGSLIGGGGGGGGSGSVADVPSVVEPPGSHYSSDGASSGSFLFEKSTLASAAGGGGDATFSANDFGDTLSHLDHLGYGIDPTDDEGGMHDGDGAVADDERGDFFTRKTPLLGGGGEEKDVEDDEEEADDEDDDEPWWIEDLEKEGWFEHDTTKVYSTWIPPKKPPNQTLHEESLADNSSGRSHQLPPPGGTVGEQQSKAAADSTTQLEDDASDTSTVGIEDNDDVIDWEERLWSLARSHYLEFSGGANREKNDGDDSSNGDQQNSVSEKKQQSITIDGDKSVKDQESQYHSEYAMEQQGVLVFRSLLLKCVEMYVNAFHRKVADEEKNDDDTVEGGRSRTSESTTTNKKKWSNHPISLKVYQYIPLPTARALFLEVIAMADSGEMSLEGLENTTTNQLVTTSVEQRADVVTSILVDDALNIFRRYQVITMKVSPKITRAGRDAKKSRKRLLNKGKKSSSGDNAQAELENYLYGEMFDDEELGGDDDQDAPPPDILETKEHEIRIRSDVIKSVLDNNAKPNNNDGLDDNGLVWRANGVICKVLLTDIRTITTEEVTTTAPTEDGQTKNDDDDDDQPSSSSATDLQTTVVTAQQRQEEAEQQPMAHLYSLRYSPVFLLKALSCQQLQQGTVSRPPPLKKGDDPPSSEPDQGQITYKDLTNLLFDDSYLIKRFELQGPYDATITHLSNWQSAFYFQNNIMKCRRDDNKEYTALHTAVVTALCSHLKTTLKHTGFQESKAVTRKGGDDDDGDDDAPTSENETDGGYITTHNYANIVATCLEIGRALHHLGVCLGRRQRDVVASEEAPPKEDVDMITLDGTVIAASGDVSLEITSYKSALEAYKAAIYVLSKAEKNALANATGKITKKKGLGSNGRQRKTNVNGDHDFQQDREASNTRRDTSAARDMPNNDELQEIREAKISVELHLADTLNCLGFCHDSKLSEYDKSLMAYRESLSLYIRHVGRFHKMVSNALHNMGAIHVELSQWREAASCFRQCLAILKRKAEKEQMDRPQGHQHDETTDSSKDAERSQMFVTLQSLGNSLAELGDYDASIACFQEIINSSDTMSKDGDSNARNTFTAEVLSQMTRVHMNQASKLSRDFNWQCHLLLFSESDSKKDEDPGLILARQLHIEQDGKKCIKKSIHSRRKLCYTAVATDVATMEETKADDGVIFSSLDNNGQFSTVDNKKLTFHVSTEAPTFQLDALAKDLLVAGRLEFRSCSYKAALSYCWEAFLLRGLLVSRNLSDIGNTNTIRDLLVFDNGFLESEGTLFQVPDQILMALDVVGIPSITDNEGIESVQLMFLTGASYTRHREFDKARVVMQRAQALLDSASLFAKTDHNAQGTLEEAVIQFDVANLYLRVGFVENELGNVELAASKYKEAIQVFNSTATHPVLTSGSKTKNETGEPEDGNLSLHELHRKELEMVLKNGLACALHRLGQTYADQGKSEKAMKCLEDTGHILNEIHDLRAEFSDWKKVPALPFASRCFWEEISAVSTSMILIDANERSGRIGMNGDSNRFSLQCFDRAIGMREFITITLGSAAVDTENCIECFEESKWDKRNMDCYSAILLLIEKRELKKGEKLTEGEEKSWKIYPKFGVETGLESEKVHPDGEPMQSDESLLTKEDVLFRIGNLLVKSGRFRDAIDSYKESEELTVARLGTKDHSIVMNILHNMGNAYRAISLSSPSRERESRSAKEEAIACYSESIRISQAFFGKQHVTSAESMQHLAILYTKAGSAWLDILNEEKSDDNDDELAYKSFKESLLIRRRENGTQNELEMAFILHNLGDLCLRKIGYYYRCDDAETLRFVEDAMNFLSESLKIRKILLGQDHANIGDTYQSIGVAHLNRALALKSDSNKMDSEIGKASRALTTALEIRRAVSSATTKTIGGPNNGKKDSILMEAHCLFYIGCVEETRSKYDEAKSHYLEALRLFQAEGKQRLLKMSPSNEKSANLDDDSEGKLLIELEAINLWAARTLFHMASIHRATGCHGEAVSCYDEALRIRSQCKSTKKHGLNNALIHLDLAKALHDNHNYDRSIECYSYSLRTYLAHFGKDSLDVADTLTGMGRAFANKSVFEKTMQCYDKAMRVYEYREGLALKEKKGLLHREIAYTVQRLDGDIFEVLEHYRSSVSFLEEFNERHRAAAAHSEKSDQELNKQLLLYYSEMLTILRHVLGMERDSNIKAELRDEIGDVLHRMGNLHATFGEYDEAMGCFSEVLQTLRKASNDELRIADLLFNMGNIYLEQGLPAKSLDCLRESYDITKEAFGGDNAELHHTMYLMGVAMINVADYKSASKWLTRALSVLKSNDDEMFVDEAARGKTLHQTGVVYEKTGDQSKAISCFQESVEILKNVQGNDLDLSNALNSMGNLLRNVSDFEHALDCYGQSLTIRTGLGDELLTANTKNNIGAVLSAMEDLDRAMAFSAEALRVKTQRLGCNSSETARGLVNMGQLYLDQKLYTSAEKYFQRGLRTFRLTMGNDHPDIAMCMHKLGVIREALFDDEGALDYYRQSTHILKSNKEKNVTLAFSLHNTALIYVRRGKGNFGTALEYMTEALDTKMAALGASHSETAASQHWLGTIHLELEDSEAALSYFKDALKVRVECFGTEHLDVAGTLYGLGQVHFARDEFEETIECLIESLRVLQKYGCGEGEVSKSELLLGSSYQELGQFDIANEHLSEALHMMISIHGVNQLDVAQALFRLGICLCETSQYSESLEKFQECLEIRTTLLGNLHIECANTCESIGIVQQKTECHEDAINSFERALAIKKASLEDDDEDFCILLHFIGSSLFALKRYKDAEGYFGESTERKKKHYGRADDEYAMSVIDLAAAYAKSGDEFRSMECYREAIESGGLPSDSWDLGVAHKCLAGYFFGQNMLDASLESYSEAASIFEWNIDNVLGTEAKHDDVIQCYIHLLDLEDEHTGPISETRAELCYKLANSYVQVNKHEDAVLMYREAIMIQTQLHGTDHMSVANSLHNLGNCYRSLCDFEKSAECLTKSLSLSTMNFEEENEEVADTCHCLAMTLMSTCELDEAISLFERALAIRKKRLGALDLNIASTLYNLAHILQLRGNWNAAMKNCKEALRIQRMTVGDDSPITVCTLECIGRIHMDKREFENAIQCFSNCISQGKSKLQRECGVIHQFRGESVKARKLLMEAGIYASQQLGLLVSESGNLDLLRLTSKFEERKHETRSKDLLSFAEHVMFYGSVLMNLAEFSEALECFRFSNIIFQAIYGSDHLTLGENLHHTGFLLEKMSDLTNDQQQLDEALELLTEALRIRQLHLVGSHPDLEETLLCLGKAHHKIGNIGEALNFLTEAVKARDARLGRKHARMDDADALLQVGQLHQQSGQFRQALDSFEESLDIRRQILGRDDPSIGELLFYIGNLLREVGDLDLAQLKFEESLAIAEREDPESIETADILFSLGVLHTEQKHFTLALDAYHGSLQIHKSRGSTNVAIAEILNNIGITYFGMKDFERAQVNHAQALESLREELGDNHVDVAFCWHSLGVVHQELCDEVEALKCFQKAVRIERSELNLASLGMCLVRAHDNENAYVCLDEALRMKTLDCGNDADDDLAEIRRHLGTIWMRKNKFDEALKCFEEALKIKLPSCSESEKDHINLMSCFDGALEAVSELFGTQHIKYARLLHQKGNQHGAKKEHSLAIEAYVEALRIYKGEHGDSHLSVANTLFNLGVSLNAKGSPDKAIRCFTKALRITKARLGEDHLDVSDTYEQVAESYKLLLSDNEAISYYEKALHVRKQATGGNDLKSAAIMHELGQIHSQEGLWDNAERAFKESIRIRTVQLGQDDPLVAESMYNLGIVYTSRGDSTKALKYLEGSLRIHKSKLDSADPQLADNFRSLGGVHRSLGNVDKSVFCYDKSMRIYTEVYGENNENIALSLSGKGETLRSDEQLQAAVLCFSQFLDIRKLIDGSAAVKESGDILSQMGEIYSQLGDNANASLSFASALTTYKQIFGSKHETVADVLQKMSDHFVKVGEFERGFSGVKEALSLRQELLGLDDTKTGDSHYCMGRILYEWKCYAESSKCFEKARDIHKQKLGETHLSVSNASFYLGCICERKGDYESAVRHLQDSLSGKRGVLDEMNNEIAENHSRLGHVYFKQSEWDASVAAFSDCLKIREATRGADTASQINVADALFDLGTALQKALDTQRSLQLFTDALKEYQRHSENPKDVKIAKCHSCIGEVYEKTNDLSNAVNSLETATAIYEHHVGTDPKEKEMRAAENVDAYSGQAETLFRLATAKDRLGEEVTALKQYRRAMRLYKSLFGRDNLHVAKILNRLANMKGRAGSVDKAMVLFDESLRIRMLHLGNNHEDVAETLFGMGIVFEKRRDYGAAMKAYSDCLRIRSSKFGSDSMEVAQVVVNIGVVRGNKGDFSGALKSWNKALSIYRKHGLGDDDALVATVLGHQRLANQLKRRGRNKN